ncbi:hypothetical protein N0A02_24260 [Paraburkholderia acidicola]|uniref:Uncharacterized protein n=1 Tax=Paraburkholderia acidicola TaxID=1912599 RepID=A0ABV1LTG9_9BURK
MSSRRVDNSSQQPQIAHHEEQQEFGLHTKQLFKIRKLRSQKARNGEIQGEKAEVAHWRGVKYAESRNKRALSAAAQKRMAPLGTPPQRGTQGGKQARLRERDKALGKEIKDPDHEKEVDKEHLEKDHPREHDQQPLKEREREREKEKDKERQQQQQSGKDQQKDSGSQQQQQQQHQGREQRQNGDGQPQQQQGQQQKREGKDENSAAKFAVTRKKVSTAVKVLENFQVLGAKLKDAPPAERNRVLLQTFAKVGLRLFAQLDHGFALAPLAVLIATSPAAMRRSPGRMQAQIAAATFNFNSRAVNGPPATKTSASVGLLSHTYDMSRTRQIFGVEYPMEEQNMLSIRQIMIDAKATMPTLVASHGVPTGSDNPPELRVAPAPPAAGS